MKKLISLIILFTFFISGCTNPVKSELLDYVNVLIPSVSILEEEALSKYENMVNDTSLSPEEMYLILEKDIIPTYKEFINSIEEIDLKTDEMKKIHNIYIKGSKTQLEAFSLISKGLLKKDNSTLEKANIYIDDTKKYMNEFQDEIKSLANTLKVRYDN